MRRLTAGGVRFVLHPVWRLTRGLTLGVRALVADREDRVLLIEHTYVPGWHLPGGGVERGETVLEALGRELAEEAAIRATAPPVLFGLYANFRQMAGDHVALFVVRDWEPVGAARRRLEIARSGMFPAGHLPEGTTASTRRRIEEVLGGLAPAGDW